MADRNNDRKRAESLAPEGAELAGVVHRNIHSLLEVRRKFEREKSWPDRAADLITRFTGSMIFVAMHLVMLVAWFAINLGLISGVKPFDPYPFVMLAMAASVEAIFLSTFVLISQNRAAALAERRAELDLQINLLSEHEITRLVELVDLIADHLGLSGERRKDVEELKKDVDPETVLNVIEEKAQQQREGQG